MTPIAWRKAGVDDADALAHLGAATFLASFANDHPGKPLIEHLNAEHSPQYYTAKLANPNVDIVLADTIVADEKGQFVCCRKSLVPRRLWM